MPDFNSSFTGAQMDAAVQNAKTPADLKSAYESNPNTNAFTDADASKLAAAPGSPAEVKAQYESNSDTNAFTDDEKTGLAEAISDHVLWHSYAFLYQLTPEVLAVGVSTYDSPDEAPSLDLASNISYVGGKLTYTGDDDIWVRCIAELTLETSSNGVTFNFFWAKNWVTGAPSARDMNSRQSAELTNNAPTFMKVSWWVQLTNGDTLDVVASASAGASVTINQAKYMVTAIDRV